MTKQKTTYGNDAPLAVGSAITMDKLGRRSFVRQAVEALVTVSHSSSVSISIEGAWGSGKTSILSMMEEALREEAPSTIVVHFNPWLVGDREALLRQFLSSLEAAIGKSDHSAKAKTVSKEIKSYLKVFDVVKLVPGAEPWASLIKSVLESAGEAAGDIGNLKSVDIETQRDKLKVALQKFGRRVVVFIDDIDRLYPAEVFEVVRIVKAVGDLPHVCYVLALDPSYASRALASLNVPLARAYLDKIIQVRLTVPNLSISARGRLLQEAIDGLPEECKQQHFPDEQDRLHTLWFFGLRALLDQPRDYVRVFNVVRTLEPQLRGELIFADIVAFAALTVKASSLVTLLRKFPEYFVGQQMFDGGNIDGAEKLVKKGRRARRKAYDLSSFPPVVRKLVQLIFPKVGMDENGFHLDDSSLPNGRLGSPERLAIVLHQGATETDVSLALVRRFIRDSSTRAAVDKELSAKNCGEFLAHIGDVSKYMPLMATEELRQLIIDTARLIETRVFVDAHRDRSEAFTRWPEKGAHQTIEELVQQQEEEVTRELALAVVTDRCALSVAALILEESYLDKKRDEPAKFRLSKDQRDVGVGAFVTNVTAEARSGELFERASPGRILRVVARLASNQASDILGIFQSRTASLDLCVAALTRSGWESKGGWYHSLHDEDSVMGAYAPMKSWEEWGRQRLADVGLGFPQRAAWMAMVEKKAFYEDGSLKKL